MNSTLPPISSVAGRRLLFAMATEAEYGRELQRRFVPLITGVGPVEAAASTAAALTHLACAGQLPDVVVCLGSAGSRSLEQTEIYQVAQVSYRDMDASPLGFAKGVTPFLDLAAAIALPLRIPGIKSARLSTGAAIVNGTAYDAVDADMVDMETYAVLRAAMRYAVPLIGLRGISDGRDELRHLNDWQQYLHIVDAKLADAIDRLAESVQTGRISIPA